MTGTVLQVNVSPGGIPKVPVEQALVTGSGVEGDSHAHPQYHGGPKQVVLMLASEVLTELTGEGFALLPGSLGENVTTKGLDPRAWRAGQRWRIGDQLVIELTKLREPCKTLSRYGRGIQKMVYDARAASGDVTSPHWAMGGFYAAVIVPGVIRKGDTVTLLAN